MSKPKTSDYRHSKKGTGDKMRYNKRNTYPNTKDTGARVAGCNNPAWYNPDQNLFDQATRISFGTRVGDVLKSKSTLPVNLSNVLTGSFGASDPTVLATTAPTAVALYFQPCAGFSLKDKMSPINQAANQVIAYMNRQNGRVPNYTGSDIMLRMMAYDSILIAISDLIRVYKAVTFTNPANKFAPRAIVEAMGFDFDDVVNNYDSLRSNINEFIRAANTIYMPSNFPVFARHMTLASDVYKDVESDKCNYTLFTPECLYRFKRHADYGPMCESITWHHQQTPVDTLTWYYQQLRSMLEALVNDEDTGRINADMLNAYGSGSIFALPYLTVSVSLEPKYDPYMLNQIHNARFAATWFEGGVYTNEILQVMDDESSSGPGTYLQCQPRYEPTSDEVFKLSAGGWPPTAGTGRKWDELFHYYGMDHVVLDFHVPVEANTVMSGTRFTTTATVTWEAGAPIIYYTGVGSEFLTGVRVYYADIINGGMSSNIWLSPYLLSATSIMSYLSLANQVSHMPLIMASIVEGSDNEPFRIFSNTDNVTVVSKEVIERLHTVALLGEFNFVKLPSKPGKSVE